MSDNMARQCAECGSEIPETSRQGYCPACMLRLVDETGLAGDSSAGAPPPDNSAKPRSFGDYELLERLGQGGMGIVFKAVQKRLNRTVAVKMLRSGLWASEAELRRFHLEAR